MSAVVEFESDKTCFSILYIFNEREREREKERERERVVKYDTFSALVYMHNEMVYLICCLFGCTLITELAEKATKIWYLLTLHTEK